jgi:hypothetical protein
MFSENVPVLLLYLEVLTEIRDVGEVGLEEPAMQI